MVYAKENLPFENPFKKVQQSVFKTTLYFVEKKFNTYRIFTEKKYSPLPQKFYNYSKS